MLNLISGSEGQVSCSHLHGQSVEDHSLTLGSPRPCPVTARQVQALVDTLPFPQAHVFRFLWASSCGPGKCPLRVCGLKLRRGSCLHSVYQKGRHVNACSICSQCSPFGCYCRNSNPVAKGKYHFFLKEGNQDVS